MNVLVMSISKKVPMLKAIKDALHQIEGTSLLFGADTNDQCIGRYFVDEYWHCPPLSRLPIQDFIEYCLTKNITVVFPSRDGELSYFAQYRGKLGEKGIYTMISDIGAVELSLDKLLFSQKLNEVGFSSIPSFEDVKFDTDHYVVKERFGAASKQVGIRLNRDQALRYSMQLRIPIFQPYIDGVECSADVYVDQNYQTKGVIVRKRNYVEAGESQITASFHHPGYEKMFGEIAEYFRLKGHVMFQFIVDQSGTPHIIECNARFGGASTLSLSMGLDSFYWFIQESRGIPSSELPFKRSLKEKTLIRHAEDFII
ncbi:ATP-grasp domain-containing protein [Paenibacillus sp. M1]|uniref:ATP-grasp domain-containing protein n=1 Tax=Paenibacillus haidiansis TaxID=1574488 RepID=A0ABU7VWE6_9BACL